MALQLPYTINPDDNIDAQPLQANFQAIVDKFSGGIVDADISILAGILGTKIAANSLPGDRIASGTITKTQMGTNSVGVDQIEALAVDKTKLSVTAGSRITKTQMELKVYATTGNSTPLVNPNFSFIELDLAQAVVAGTNSWVVKWRVGTHTAGGAIAVASGTFTPATAIPVATTTVVGLVAKNVAVGASITFDTDMLYIENS